VAGRIVVFGATGYTGQLVSHALTARGARPVLAARSRDKLAALAGELGGGLETAVADVADPASVRALVERGDVLVSTVGPFARWGDVAAGAAIDAGASYVDSTGEPAFIRRIFERYGPQADRAGAGMLTAAGYDWVPGNLAGALALREAGNAAAKVAVGYFLTGGGDPRGAMSGGTAASAAGTFLEPSFAYRDGRIVAERGGRRARAFRVKGRDLYGISVGGTEHFTLPRVHPGLREVEVSLGWLGPASRAMPVVSGAVELVTRLPPVRSGLERLLGKLVKGSTGGPDAQARSRSGSHVVGVALDAAGRELAQVHVTGVNGYTFTGDFIAWAAAEAAERGFLATGALGPVDAFGLERLEQGVDEAGLRRTPDR
jgi:short subunit dehydrogenase-like uncharacterized protein